MEGPRLDLILMFCFILMIPVLISNIYRIYKQIVAERKFIPFLKIDPFFQYHSKVRPGQHNLVKYQNLITNMLEKDGDLTDLERRLILQGAVYQNSFQGRINYMEKLWIKSRN